MSDAASKARVESDGYVLRPFESGDRERFLSLYDAVWGHEKSAEWFDWRFRENPYGRGVRMVVVERDGQLVGAEPVLPYRVRAGRATCLAYQPVDWIVHPDHRRRGLFTRMTERLLDSFGPEPSFLFNFPTDVLLPGLRKFDWHVVGTLPNYYRVQCPSSLFGASAKIGDGSPVLSATTRVMDPVVKRYLRVSDRLRCGTDEFEIERHDAVPAAELVEVHDAAPIDRVHVSREEAFYRWRFSNPLWETTTYLARSDGTPVGSVVAATEAVDDVRRTSLLDVQPMRPRQDGIDALPALLRAVIADHRDVDLLKVAGAGLPPVVLRRCGFVRGDRFPLSTFSVPATFVVRPVPGTAGTKGLLGTRDLVDLDDWVLSLADQDVA